MNYGDMGFWELLILREKIGSVFLSKYWHVILGSFVVVGLCHYIVCKVKEKR